MNPSNPMTIRRLAAIESAIKGGQLDYREIAAKTFTSEAYTLRILKTLRESKVVHIAAWRLYSNTYAAVYAWGAGRNAKRPRPMTPTEGQAAYRERIRKDPEANEFFLAAQRAKDRARRAVKNPQTWLSALGV